MHFCASHWSFITSSSTNLKPCLTEKSTLFTDPVWSLDPTSLFSNQSEIDQQIKEKKNHLKYWIHFSPKFAKPWLTIGKELQCVASAITCCHTELSLLTLMLSDKYKQMAIGGTNGFGLFSCILAKKFRTKSWAASNFARLVIQPYLAVWKMLIWMFHICSIIF